MNQCTKCDKFLGSQNKSGLCKNHYNIAYTKNWKKNNPIAHASQQERYRQKHQEELHDYYVTWRSKNRRSYNAYQKTRKKRVKQATPSWADLVAIRKFYYNCPEGYHVDHVVPIKGKTVSGLHVLNNLQYLQALPNLRKSNKFVLRVPFLTHMRSELFRRTAAVRVQGPAE
jgi:hypothetical protein